MALRNYIQFPAKFQPVDAPPPPEAITLDKWEPKYTVRTPRRALSFIHTFPAFFASIAAATIFPASVPSTPAADVSFPHRLQYQAKCEPVTVPAPGEQITLDKWLHSTSQPTRKLQPRQFPQLFKPPDQLDGSRLDAWNQPTAQPTYRKQRLSVYESFFYPPAQLDGSRLDFWLQPPSQPTYRKQRLTKYTAFFFPPPQLDGSRLEDWQQLHAQPTRKKVSIVDGTTLVAPVMQPVPRLDSWNPGTNQRPTPRTRTVSGWLTESQLLEVAELVTLDEWFRETNQRYPERKKLVGVGEYTIDPHILTQGENITADKWSPIYPTFLRGVRAVQRDSFFAPVQFVEDITLDKWFTAFVSRSAQKPRPLTQLVAPPFVEVTLTDYVQSLEVRSLVSRVRQILSSEFAPVLVEPPVDSWLPILAGLTHTPIKRTPIIVQPQVMFVEVTLDQWLSNDVFVQVTRERRSDSEFVAPVLVPPVIPFDPEEFPFVSNVMPHFERYWRLLRNLPQAEAVLWIFGLQTSGGLETINSGDRGFVIRSEDRNFEGDASERGFNQKTKDRNLNVNAKNRRYKL